MAKLVWQFDGQEPMAYPLRHERVSIGRDVANDVRLSEHAVSARHAVVITRANAVTLHDLQSSNGSWVNGKRVESQTLRHGDVIQIGRMALTFVDESEASESVELDPTKRDGTAVLGGSRVTPITVRPEPLTSANQTRPTELPDLRELDRLLGSIREHRKSEVQNNDAKRAELMLEWQRTLQYADALKIKLAEESRIRFFDVSERRGEVVLRLEKAPGQPTQLLMLTWGHAELKERGADGIWLRQPNSVDKRYDKSADALREMVATLAHLLA